MKVVVLQPPSPPRMNVKRDYAGGMGVADPSAREAFGHDAGYITLPYMSLLYAAAVLEKAGDDVRFIDAQTANLDIEGVLGQLRADPPACVVSVVNLPSIYGDLEVAKAVRERAGVPTILVGAVTGPLYEEIARSGAADVVLRGDPEPVIAAVARSLVERGAPGEGFEQREGAWTNRVPARITDLDALPSLPYHLVPIERYWYHGFGQGVPYAAVFASRGCSFKCYYCPYPMGFGDCIVHRDPVRVVDEIEALQKEHGIRGILFRDQVFTMDWPKTTRLCDEILRRGMRVEWVAETRLDRVNPDLLRKMKAAGCRRIHYGLESGDPVLFSRVGKDQAARMETLIENFRLTERIGIHPHMFILIGLLGETRDTIRRTIETIRRIRPLTLQVAVVTPYPGTPLFEEARSKGLILTYDWSKYTGFQPVARTEALSADELLDGRRRILAEHAHAVKWKRRRHKAHLAVRYLRDGSLWRRLAGKAGFVRRPGPAPA